VKRAIGAVIAIPAVLTMAFAGSAHAATLTGYLKACTLTNPEYVIADQNTQLTYSPGSYQFSASVAGSRPWKSAYLVTGYSRGNNSAQLCGRAGNNSYKLPVHASDNPEIISSLSYSGTFKGRPGWDIWLVRSGKQYAETSATDMEHDANTVEVMVQPGSRENNGKVQVNQPGWHRAYVSEDVLSNVNLGGIVNGVLARMGLRPSGYYWEAIDGGWEGTSGTFYLNSYSLSVTTSASAMRSATATGSFTASSGTISVTRAVRKSATVTRTVTLPVKVSALPTVHAEAQAEANASAATAAMVQAGKLAGAAARSAALDALSAKLGARKVPNVRGMRLVNAISALHRAGFAKVQHPKMIKGRALYVTGQSPAAGTRHTPGQVMTLRAARR
jgi:hypothetical protein